MQKEKVIKCCICGAEIKDYKDSNDPWGAMWRDANGNICEPTYNVGERCCKDCSKKYVIPGRLYKLKKQYGGNR